METKYEITVVRYLPPVMFLVAVSLRHRMLP